MESLSSSKEALREAVIHGEPEQAVATMEQVLKEGVQAIEVAKLLQESLRYVGLLFEEKEYFLVEMFASAKTVQKCFEQLRPRLLVEGTTECKGVVVLGTVRNDVHDIGKNLVKLVLETHGYEVYDLGVNVPSEKFVEAARRENADVVGLSSLMTVSMLEMKQTLDSIKNSDLHNVLVIVGGAPVSQEFADKIGADGYAEDASQAVSLIDNLLKTK